jgi:hypothetical protein
MDALKILNAIRGRAADRLAQREARRNFLRSASGFAAGAAGTLALTACGGGGGGNSATAQTTGPSDPDILNFALNLEYLEANFYSYAATGNSIAASLQTGTGTQGAVVPGQKANLSNPLVIAYANEIYQDELNHVMFLRSALGSSAVAQPAIDVSASPTGAFSTAAQAAGLVPAGTAFNPYASDEAFLLGAYIFEDVGVTAYHGAASQISSKTYLDAAAGILAVEAYHAGLVRTALYAMGLATPAPSINPFTATAAISAARAKLDGTNNDDQGIQGANSTISNIVDANSNSIAYDRTVGQVLNIVYLNGGSVNMGGFFPAGVNGNIHTSA